MPPYATSGTNSLALNSQLPSLLWPGDDLYLFGTSPGNPGAIPKANDTNVITEVVAVGERSIACQLCPRPGGGYPPGCLVQVIANANPGAAEIDVQDAAIDADGAYITPTGSAAYKITTWTQIGGSANYLGTTELVPEAGRFISLKVIANPNGVSFTAKISYE